MDSLSLLLCKAHQFMMKFDSRKKSFLLWQNEFEFVANILKVTDNNKHKFLLNMLNYPDFITICKQVAPTDPFSLSYDVLISMLENIFSPYQGLHAIMFRFNIRNQMTRESPVLYAQALRQILIKAYHGNHMDTVVLNRFIRGLKSDQAKQHLQQIENLTLNDAIAIAQKIDEYEINRWMH